MAICKPHLPKDQVASWNAGSCSSWEIKPHGKYGGCMVLPIKSPYNTFLITTCCDSREWSWPESTLVSIYLNLASNLAQDCGTVFFSWQISGSTISTWNRNVHMKATLSGKSAGLELRKPWLLLRCEQMTLLRSLELWGIRFLHGQNNSCSYGRGQMAPHVWKYSITSKKPIALVVIFITHSAFSLASFTPLYSL